jgi:hypothetical protein
MLKPQVVMNLLSEFGVRADLVKYGSWLVKNPSARVGRAITPQQPSECPCKGGTHLRGRRATLG